MHETQGRQTPTRWERAQIREIRRLEPEQLILELDEERYRRRVCAEALLDRAEELQAAGAPSAHVLAERAPAFVEKATPEHSELRIRALSLCGSSLRDRGRLRKAERVLTRAMELGSEPGPELAALWVSYGLLMGLKGDSLEASRWTEKAVRFFRGSDDPRAGSCDRVSLSAALVARARVGWAAGEPASSVARHCLEAVRESSPRTPASRLAACRHLASAAALAWMCEDTGFHPRTALAGILRVDQALEQEGQRKSTPCRCRVRWARALALAHAAQGVTPQAASYLAAAKSSLTALGASEEVIHLNLDVAYFLSWEGKWRRLAGLARETAALAERSEYGSEQQAALREWQASLSQCEVDPQVWQKTYELVRGARSPLVLPEPAGSTEDSPPADDWLIGW